MILHLVTARHRLAPGVSDAAAVPCLLEQVRHAVEAAFEVVQVREQDLDGRALAAVVCQALALTRGTGTRLVVNERVDVALACGADGVHLRGASFDAARVRAAAGPDFLIGRSVRSVDEARNAGPVDYLIAGTVWPSQSKPEDHPMLGADGLRQIVQAVDVPVLAIGGIDAGRRDALAAAGAAGLAAIGAWMGEAGECRAIPLHAVARTFRGGRDLAKMVLRIPHS